MSDIVSLDTAPSELVPVSFGARLSVETASAVRFCSVHNNNVSSLLLKRTVGSLYSAWWASVRIGFNSTILSWLIVL